MKSYLSLKNKLFFIFITVIIISVSSVGWYGFTSAKEAYLISALEISNGQAKALHNQIEGVLQTIPNDVIYNSNFYALKKLLVWEDLNEKLKIKYWKDIYIQSLKDYISNKKLYYQIRVIDTKGKEKIVLKYNDKTNKISQTAEKNLQDKSQKDYFKDAFGLKDGEFYISDMNLNLENDRIEKPYVPVVRYSTPIVDINGETKGVITLNFNVNTILDMIEHERKSETHHDEKTFLINKDGYYLYHRDRTKRWGFELSIENKFQNDYKDIINRFKDKDEVTFFQDEKLFSMQKIYPNAIGNPNIYWYLVTVMNEKSALTRLDNFINIFVIIFFSTIIFGILLINRFVSKFMTPLKKATMQLQKLSLGIVQKENIDYKYNDEIGQIALATNILVEAIDNTIEQANAVANGELLHDIELLSKDDKLGLSLKSMKQRLEDIALLSKTLSTGNYNIKVFAKSGDDILGLALIDLVRYLKNVSNIAESIADGNIDIDFKAQGDEDRLGLAMINMISYLKAILHQANTISNEDFSHSIEIKSKYDELGIALDRMTKMLKSSYIKNKDEIWFSDGIGEFSNKLAGVDDIVELSKKMISMSCRYVGGSSGVVYNFDKERKELSMIASYAFTDRKLLSNSFRLGESIIGQVALEKEPILLTNIKDDEFLVQSGTTLSKPKEIYAFAIIYEKELLAVVEIMSFDGFSELHKEYLSKISNIFATTLNSVGQNSQIKILLEKSQVAYEELQTQSEELQETNIQMEEQQQQLKQQSFELIEKNDILEQARQDIDIRAKDLEQASKYKNEFMANMSHELRTPLNSIILLSKLLISNPNKEINEEDIKKISVIHRAGNDLLLLINDILDLTKAESGKMDLDIRDLNSAEIVDEMEGLFGEMARYKGVDFKIEDNFKSSFKTDKTKLSQVIKNLLSNALKFTKEGFVVLRISSVDNQLKISIKDTGRGIPDDKIGIIFEAFKQVDGSISREFGGTGLGLSISKTLINLLGGEISVESQYEKGSTFTIHLPIIGKEKKDIKALKDIKPIVIEKRPIAIIEEEDIELNQKEFINKNILIVDDDSRNIFTLTSVLENLNAEVFSAFNGKEAIEILEDIPTIDIILMDIMMPVMDGINAIKKIKKDERFKNIPIIVVSAKSMDEDKKQFLDVGANDYISKPINHNALISVMKAWLK